MKVFIAFSALLAVASANPLYLAPPAIIVPAASSQYHSQDGTGGYVYGYNNHLSSKQELKSLDGTTKGSYSYVDSNNVLQTVSYIADADGFRVVATNLPKPVEAPIVPAFDLPQQVAETPEVAAARSTHLAAHEEAIQLLRSRNRASVPTGLPQQVQDTPEVAAAKAAHLAAIEEAKERLGVLHNVPIATDLPQQVQDTPEVAAAKAAHLAAIEEAKRQIGYQVIAIPLPTELPRPVVDTPEVAKAKAEHLLAVEQAKLQSAPLSVPLLPRGFSYSSSIVNGPLPQYVEQSAPLSVPLLPRGFSYSSSIVNGPLPQYGYAS